MTDTYFLGCLLESFFAFSSNAKSFAIACGVDFLLLLLSLSEMDSQKVSFAKISPSVTQEPCGQDQTYFLGYTGKYFVGDMFIITPDACDP